MRRSTFIQTVRWHKAVSAKSTKKVFGAKIFNGFSASRPNHCRRFLTETSHSFGTRRRTLFYVLRPSVFVFAHTSTVPVTAIRLLAGSDYEYLRLIIVSFMGSISRGIRPATICAPRHIGKSGCRVSIARVAYFFYGLKRSDDPGICELCHVL